MSGLADIDWVRVQEKVLTAPNGNEAALLSYEYEDVKAMIFAAAEKWLERDLKTLGDVETESRFNIHNLGHYPVRGFIDLQGVYTSGELAGSRLVSDWKTSDGELDKNWENRLVNSFQWKLYAHATRADFISYRGINRKLKTREVFLEVPEFAAEQVVRHFRLVSTQLHALVGAGAEVWTQKMPSSCGAFNSTCQFQTDCQMDAMPRYQLKSEEIGLSYSGADRFLLCPEKFRRVVKSADEGNDATRIGSAFHRGAEEVWKQAFKLGEKA